TTIQLPRSRFGLLFGLIAATFLIVSPSVHAPYYIFLLPGWTAIVAQLVRLQLNGRSLLMWVAVGAAYVFTGFDQIFFAMQRIFRFGIVVPQHWMAWHLPGIGVLLTLGTLAVLLRRPLDETALDASPAPLGLADQAAGTPERGGALLA